VTATPGIAAFDFDGTLVPGDSFTRYLSRLLGRDGLASALTRAMPAMISGYRLAGRDAAKAALLRHAVKGVEVARAMAVGEEFASGLSRQVRPYMRDRLSWHSDQGHLLVLVSASLDLYLGPFGRIEGFDNVMATALEVGDDGRLTGRLRGANVRAAQKAALLAEMIGDEQVTLWAYGDSRGDHEMLRMADHPTLVGRRRPGRRSSTGSREIRPQWTDG
jgi:phosphatidylglycerophosphatase C